MITPEELRDQIHEVIKASAPLLKSIQASHVQLAELSQRYHEMVLGRLLPTGNLCLTENGIDRGTLVHQIPLANSPNKTEAELKTITDRWPDIQWTQVIYDKQRQTFYLFANV